MKKGYIYLLMTTLAFAGVSCNSSDPDEAFSKHVYAEGEAPYLRTNLAANATVDVEFPVARINQPVVINLKDYANFFHKNLNMTLDETLAKLDAGEVVFYNISVSRGAWDLTPPTITGAEGWYYNANSAICGEADAMFSAELNRTAKTITVKALNEPEAGATAGINLGFAVKNGHDFDDYVRFSVNAAVTDPSLLMVSVSVPNESYGVGAFNFNDYDVTIQKAMNMTAKDFIKALENDEVDVYLVKNGERVLNDDGTRPDYTSGAYGYWLDSDLNITGWDGAGYPANLIFLEYQGDGNYAVGRAAAGAPSGLQGTVVAEFVLTADPTCYLKVQAAFTLE